MQIIDFANSYVTFFTKPEQGENIARILVDAACTVTDERHGTTETYYLIAPCRSERMYVDDALFQVPNYEFCGVFTADDLMIVRTHWTSDRDNREYGCASERFASVDVAIRHLAAPRLLDDDQAAVDATLANRTLVARTEIQNEDRGLAAVLEYPIKTMNVTRRPPRFQVDTGPLLRPDFASTAAHPVERFDIAHVVYHQRDRAEFVLRRPTPVGARDGEPVSVTDYSLIQTFAARNELWCGE